MGSVLKTIVNMGLHHNHTRSLKYPSVKFNHLLVRRYNTNRDIKINGINLNNYVVKLEKEYEELKIKTDALQRLKEIEPVMKILEERRNLIDSITNLNELLQDDNQEIKKLAEEEKSTFEDKLKNVDIELGEALLNFDSEDNCNSIVLEVNSGVGGQEAMLFAKELFEMYCNFVDFKGWQSEVAEYITTDLGGIRHGSLLIDGENVHRYFRYEAGVHRVQRIPATEKSGRIHTSTASVLALPQPTDIQIQIQQKDLKIETKRSTGAGGQHVNTTDSAVRIIHLPTGIAVECQVDRSQIKNRQIALQRLRAKLYQDKLDKQLAEIESTKRNQVRSNFRNEKVRTYNFSQDRITDHRLQNCNFHNLKSFFEGRQGLEDLSNKLHNNSRLENLLRTVHKLEGK